jgi:oxygen-independent coproporphyrinogen-3 oxidase
MRTFRAGGVTRISVGAQSFESRHLKTLERWHDPENVQRALDLARDAGVHRQSIDLIFGVPGQSLSDWRADLGRALALGTEHLSCYNLTYEPNTAMTARLKRGEFRAADENTEVEMYELTLAMLREQGFERYEVSNYAKNGQECRHNLAYWRQEDWLAAGPSASAHVLGQRWKNIPRLDDYLSISEDGFAPITDYEAFEPRRALSERIMTGLRLSEGLPAETIAATAAEFDEGAPVRLRKVAARNAENGLLRRSSDRWILTDEGFLLADGIALEFMEALDPVG